MLSNIYSKKSVRRQNQSCCNACSPSSSCTHRLTLLLVRAAASSSLVIEVVGIVACGRVDNRVQSQRRISEYIHTVRGEQYSQYSSSSLTSQHKMSRERQENSIKSDIHLIVATSRAILYAVCQVQFLYVVVDTLSAMFAGWAVFVVVFFVSMAIKLHHHHPLSL